jgi:hypothetical protein
MEWARILAYITGTVEKELLLRNEYLAAENRILRVRRAIYFVGVEEGAAAVFNGLDVHEFVHDSRHPLGFPCHQVRREVPGPVEGGVTSAQQLPRFCHRHAIKPGYSAWCGDIHVTGPDRFPAAFSWSRSESLRMRDATGKVANRFKNFPLRLAQDILRCVALGHIELVLDKRCLLLADAQL